MYGARQAALDDERARTGITEQQQQAAPVTALAQAASSGNYPNLPHRRRTRRIAPATQAAGESGPE
jgi:hypothetical protein